MQYINHITLNTGHLRRSPRAEVGDEAITLMAPWLISGIGSAWCAAHVHEGSPAYRDALSWLGDFERCCAWTWIEK